MYRPPVGIAPVGESGLAGGDMADKTRIIGVVATMVAAIAVGAIFLQPQDAKDTVVAGLQTGELVTPPVSLPDFSLHDQRNQPFTKASLVGHWSLIFPGFTHCPDICPTTLATLNRTREFIGSGADGLQVVLLSLDPERDTSEALAAYLAFFNEAFVGLTGEKQQLERLYAGLGIQYIRIPGAGSEYSVDHSAAVLLIDPEGRLAGYFMPPFKSDALAADLRPLLSGWRG